MNKLVIYVVLILAFPITLIAQEKLYTGFYFEWGNTEPIHSLEDQILDSLERVEGIRFIPPDETQEGFDEFSYDMDILFNHQFLTDVCDFLDLDMFLVVDYYQQDEEWILRLALYDYSQDDFIIDEEVVADSIQFLEEEILTRLDEAIKNVFRAENMEASSSDAPPPIELGPPPDASITEQPEQSNEPADDSMSPSYGSIPAQVQVQPEAEVEDIHDVGETAKRLQILGGVILTSGQKFTIDADEIVTKVDGVFGKDFRFAPSVGFALSGQFAFLSLMKNKLSIFAAGSFSIGGIGKEMPLYDAAQADPDNNPDQQPYALSTLGLSLNLMVGGGVGLSIPLGKLGSELGALALIGFSTVSLSTENYQTHTTDQSLSSGISSHIGAYYQIVLKPFNKLSFPIRLEICGQLGKIQKVSLGGIAFFIKFGVGLLPFK